MLDLGIPDDRGSRNESRLYRIAEDLVVKLVTRLPEVIRGSCRKSEHCDVHDRHGEDVSISLTVLNGSKKIHGRLIYDSKSSARKVKKYYVRGKDRYPAGPGQGDCLLRKAILICEDRSDEDIQSELLSDIGRSGLLPAHVITACQENFKAAA